MFVLLSACNRGQHNEEDFYSMNVYLPDGATIVAQPARYEVEMVRGMMFRDSLAPDHGMLFTHGEPGNYPYWMFQVRIPLDMIWVDQQHHIVEIVPNTQPCPTKPCASYGGKQKAQYVLELAAGQAAKHNLKVGDSIRF